MNLGWGPRGSISREHLSGDASWVERTGNKAASCSAIERGIEPFEGEKLNDTPEGVGVESEQLTAQHNRAASAIGERSLPLALSQHFIILSFGE